MATKFWSTKEFRSYPGRSRYLDGKRFVRRQVHRYNRQRIKQNLYLWLRGKGEVEDFTPWSERRFEGYAT